MDENALVDSTLVRNEGLSRVDRNNRTYIYNDNDVL